MSKELTALEALENIKTLFIGSSIDLSHQFDIIEAKLKRADDLQQMLYKMNVKHGYKEYLKMTKTLETILKKDFIDFKLLKKCENHYEYNSRVAQRFTHRGMDVALLTQEEFASLKEELSYQFVLKD